MFHSIFFKVTLYFLAFMIISQNTYAQNNDIENYQPPPMFGAPKLPPPKVKKPKIDTIPSISRQVDRPLTLNKPAQKPIMSPRIIKEVQDEQEKNIQPLDTNSPVKPSEKPALNESRKPQVNLPTKSIEKPKVIAPKPTAPTAVPIQKKTPQDEEPINFLEKQEPLETEAKITSEAQGVVKGPKTMPSYKKKSVEAEQTFVSQTPNETMLERVQKNKAKVIASPPLVETKAYSPASTISTDKNEFILSYKKEQIEPSDTDISATLKPLAQALAQNDKIIEIKSYASFVSGKINSDRRIALDRGLFIREYLLSNNISPYRINLRSFGEQANNAEKDWVEITLVQ